MFSLDGRLAVERSSIPESPAEFGRRTLELAATNLQLQRGIIRRKTVEAAFKKSGEHYTRLLKESLQLQEGLRQLTHQVLAAQEGGRKKISRELQDEIAFSRRRRMSVKR